MRPVAIRCALLAALLLTMSSTALAGLAGPVRVAQNIAGGGSHHVSGGLRPGGSLRVTGNGPGSVEVHITFVDAGGSVDVVRRGSFTVDIPVSARPKSSAVYFKMNNQSREMARYVLSAD